MHNNALYCCTHAALTIGQNASIAIEFFSVFKAHDTIVHELHAFSLMRPQRPRQDGGDAHTVGRVQGHVGGLQYCDAFLDAVLVGAHNLGTGLEK